MHGSYKLIVEQKLLSRKSSMECHAQRCSVQVHVYDVLARVDEAGNGEPLRVLVVTLVRRAYT